jgi:hypothetical protein
MGKGDDCHRRGKIGERVVKEKSGHLSLRSGKD